jgi:PPOX class probable F420-dependent enzyme
MPDPDLLRRAAAARIGRLATVDPDGGVHLVPFCFVIEGDVLYSAVDQKPKRSRDLRRLRNLRERPRATALIDHYEEDWSALWWLRLRGTARILEAEEPEARRALALLAEKYPQYRREPPPGPVIALDVTERRGWAAAGPGAARAPEER